MTRARFFAWAVHAYTALGLAAAALIAVLIVQGGDAAFRAAFALMLAATAIDATDGWLARLARVKETLPEFDGRRLDDLIDFHTYTSLPLLLIWRAGIMPGEQALWLLAPLVASAYGFSQADAKTDDGHFLGFPSYWNIVAFYLYFLKTPFWFSLSAILFLSALTFVPWRYLYPTQTGRWSVLTNLLAAIWVVQIVVILTATQEHRWVLAMSSLLYPAYYMGLSWWITWRLRRSLRY